MSITRSKGSYRFTEHSHDGFCEFVYMQQGFAVHTVNGSRLPHSEGQLLLIREHDIHSLRGEGLIITNTAFPLSWFDDLLQAWHSSEWYSHLLSDPIPPLFAVPVSQRGEIAAWLDQLMQHRHSVEGRAHFSRFLNAVMVDYFLPHYTSGSIASRPMPEWLEQVLRWLNEQPKPVQLDVLYRESGRCREHVSRSFRRYVGVSPSQYLNQLRLDRVAELLTSTNFPVLEICFEVGFENPSYFHRLFKARFQISPDRYRKGRQRVLQPE